MTSSTTSGRGVRSDHKSVAPLCRRAISRPRRFRGHTAKHDALPADTPCVHRVEHGFGIRVQSELGRLRGPGETVSSVFRKDHAESTASDVYLLIHGADGLHLSELIHRAGESDGLARRHLGKSGQERAQLG